jgi:hypothetical protein
MIRKSKEQYFKKIDSEYKYGLAFDVSEEMIGEPVLFIATYLPPFGSPAYGATNENGIDILEEEILHLKEQHHISNHSLLISGDFNARTKDVADYIHDDQNKFVPLPENYPEDCFNIPRNSRDICMEISITMAKHY